VNLTIETLILLIVCAAVFGWAMGRFLEGDP
jgi:hypothetical protein